MKTIKNVSSSTVKRVSDDKASVMVKEGWSYCPKSKWKVLKGTTKTPADKKENVPGKELSKQERKKSKKSSWKKNKQPPKEIQSAN